MMCICRMCTYICAIEHMYVESVYEGVFMCMWYICVLIISKSIGMCRRKIKTKILALVITN